MNRRRIGIIVTLIGSLILGVLFGWISYLIFKDNVPQQLLSNFQASASPVEFIGSGLLYGLAIFVWTLLVGWILSRSRGGEKQ